MRSASLTLVATLVVAAGCGGGGSGGEVVAPDGTATTTVVPVVTTASTADPTTTVDAEGISELEALAPGLLIAAAELGIEGARDLGYAPTDTSPRCDFDLDVEHAVDVHVGTTLEAGGYTVTEIIRVLAEPGAAADAFDAWVANEGPCRPPDPEVTGPVDVNDRVGADRAVSFTVPTRGGAAVLVVALVGDALVSFDQSGVPMAPDGAYLLDPLDVAAFGVGKILAALEA